MKIQYSKLNFCLNQEDLNKIKQIIESGWVCSGKWVEKLEQYFKNRFNVRYAIACANATSGLISSVHALSQIEDRKLLFSMPAFTWYSTKYAVENCKIKFHDIDPETFLLDTSDVEDFYKSDYIINVDIFGNNSRLYNCNIPTIYDAAHGFGLKDLGNRGLIEVVSLSYTKLVSGMQGGIILTNSMTHYNLIKELISNYAKLTEVNAYMALKSIDNFEFNQSARLKCIKFYRENIKIPFCEQKITSDTNYSVYGIILESPTIRNKIIRSLDKNEIEYKIYYEPVSEVPFLNTMYIYNRIICLPVYEELLYDGRLDFICKIINEAL